MQKAYVEIKDGVPLLDAESSHLKASFVDTCCLGTSSKDVHLVWEIVRGAYSGHFVEEAVGDLLATMEHLEAVGYSLSSRIHQVEFCLVFH